MASGESTADQLREKIEELQREKADLIASISKCTDPILINGQALLHIEDASEESLQQSISVLNLSIANCSDVKRNLQHKFRSMESATATDSTEPPPSYSEVISSQLQSNNQSHDPSSITSSGRGCTPYECKAKFKPHRLLPEGTYLAPEEKKRPIPTYYGLWEFLLDGGWTYNVTFNSFVPPVLGVYNVTLQWRQKGEGEFEAGLGTVNESSVTDLYSKITEAKTTSHHYSGHISEIIDLKERQGVWVSLLRFGKYPELDYFIFSADLVDF